MVMDVPVDSDQAGDPKASGRGAAVAGQRPISGSTRSGCTRRSARICSGSTARAFISPASTALLNAIASADSDAMRLDAFPLAELSRSLAAVDGKHPTAEQLADADVLLSAAFTSFGENMLTGQAKPSELGQSWHINPLEERIDSALALTSAKTISRRDSCECVPRIPGTIRCACNSRAFEIS